MQQETIEAYVRRYWRPLAAFAWREYRKDGPTIVRLRWSDVEAGKLAPVAVETDALHTVRYDARRTILLVCTPPEMEAAEADGWERVQGMVAFALAGNPAAGYPYPPDAGGH